MSKNLIFLLPISSFILTMLAPFFVPGHPEIGARLVIIGTYLSLIAFSYSVKKANRIDIINMSTKFDKSNKVFAREYLTYLFNSSVVIFSIAALLSLFFNILEWPIWLDFYFSIVSCVLWVLLTFKKSRDIMKNSA